MSVKDEEGDPSGPSWFVAIKIIVCTYGQF